MVHYLSPPVVYYEAETEIFFNPKSTQNLIKSYLANDEMIFINAKIDGNQIDFEFNVDHETTFHNWYKYNRAKGVVGDQTPAANQTFKMLWETGYADNHVMENLHCSYDNATCYEVKTVPVIFDISTINGYRTGGQNLTLSGNGLNVGTPNILVDGVNCAVTA